MINAAIFHKDDPKVNIALKYISNALKGTIKLTKVTGKIRGNFDLLIAVGGDGTVLRACRLAASHGIPILGVNLGRLGFLTEISPSEIKKAAKSIIADDYELDERMMISADVIRKGKKIASTHALNDIVVSKSGIARLATFELSVDGEKIRVQHADGLIVSTPTGSTAYNISAGGPIIYPIYPLFVITAICPHTMSERPLVIPARRDLELVKVVIKVTKLPGKGGGVMLTADGQSTLRLMAGDEIVIKEAPFRANFIRVKKYSFFKVLREKLNWS